MENVKIYDMTLEDFENIKDILISEFDDFWTPQILKNEIIGENKKYIVAKNDDAIVGFAGLFLSVDNVEIMNIVTKKTERGKGVGRMMLIKLIEFAKNNNYEAILLEVNENNIPARKLYESTGFEQIGFRKEYYNSTDNAIIMSKKVNIL